MALITLQRPIIYPGVIMPFISTTPAIGAITVDAAGEYSAVILQAKEAMTISHVGFGTGTVTGGGTADIRIETVDTDGFPSGSLWAANTNKAGDTLTSSTFLAPVALTASASISQGQVFAVKIGYNSGTSFTPRHLTGVSGGLPYRVGNTGTPTKSNTPVQSLVLGSGASTFYNIDGALPISSVTNAAFDNTNTAARGARFKLPFKARVCGLFHWNSTSTGSFNAVLYDDTGAELSSSSTLMDGGQTFADATSKNRLIFDNPVTVDKDTWYRAAIEPSEAVNSSIFTITTPSSGYLAACPGGANYHYAACASGSWTTTGAGFEDTFPLLDLLLDQVDDGTGSGSGARVIGG